MKKLKVLAAIILVLAAFCSFATISLAKPSQKNASSQSVEEGIRLEDATPEQLEEIGVGAQIAAGQNPDNVTVVTQSDLLPVTEEEESSGLSALEIVLIVLVAVLFAAVGVLYYFCIRAGIFNKRQDK